jgi:xanthine dehydrogenase accessory factor
LVSGGCLEGDLIEHAKRVFTHGQARIVTYDLRGDKDEFWGLDIGCNGLTRLLLQPVAAENDYEPMRSITSAWRRPTAKTITFITSSAHPRMPIGATRIQTSDDRVAGLDRPFSALDALLSSLSEVRSLRPGITHLSGIIDGCEVHALRQVLVPLPRILVLGAGPDAAPVVQGFLALVWRVTVGDEREGALTRAELGSVERLYVRHDVNLTEFLHRAMPSAIIIMSHNLRANARYLRLVADCDCVYLGVLGPGHRRERLLEGLEPQVKSRVKSRLRGPIGLHIGADSPASIALSIVTQVFIEIKAFLSEAGSVPPAEDAEKLTAGRVTRADRASSLG